jgi:hypothetical protein
MRTMAALEQLHLAQARLERQREAWHERQNWRARLAQLALLRQDLRVQELEEQALLRRMRAGKAMPRAVTRRPPERELDPEEEEGYDEYRRTYFPIFDEAVWSARVASTPAPVDPAGQSPHLRADLPDLALDSAAAPPAAAVTPDTPGAPAPTLATAAPEARSYPPTGPDYQDDLVRIIDPYTPMGWRELPRSQVPRDAQIFP